MSRTQGILRKANELWYKLSSKVTRGASALRETLRERRAAERPSPQRVLRGDSRRIVLLRPSAPRVFEEAVFLVREGAEESEEELLSEAERCMLECTTEGYPAPHRALWFVLGAAAALLARAIF